MNQMIARDTGRAGDYLFGEDEGTDLRAEAAARASAEEIKQRVHIANGGESVQMVDCPKCRGSGMTRWGRCFRCEKSKVRGKVTMRSAAASKAVQTRKENDERRRDEFQENHAAEIRYVWKRSEKGSTFYSSFADKIREFGFLTENQLAVVQKDIAKDQAYWEAKRAAAPVVNISAIEALFATAIENDVKRPIFRADGLEISRAPANGRNAGALYVKRDGEYAGKIVGGKFQKVYAAPADTLDKLMAVAADPLKEAMAYGRKFGNCALCGRGLVDPVSIRAKVGPICAPKWGLDWMREAARDSLAAEEEGQ